MQFLGSLKLPFVALRTEPCDCIIGAHIALYNRCGASDANGKLSVRCPFFRRRLAHGEQSPTVSHPPTATRCSSVPHYEQLVLARGGRKGLCTSQAMACRLSVLDLRRTTELARRAEAA